MAPKLQKVGEAASESSRTATDAMTAAVFMVRAIRGLAIINTNTRHAAPKVCPAPGGKGHKRCTASAPCKVWLEPDRIDHWVHQKYAKNSRGKNLFAAYREAVEVGLVSDARIVDGNPEPSAVAVLEALEKSKTIYQSPTYGGYRLAVASDVPETERAAAVAPASKESVLSDLA